MSIAGPKRRFDAPPTTSGLPQSTDISRVSRHVAKGAIAKPSSVDVRHPLAFVLQEGAAGDVRPYAAGKKQQSETQSEYLYVRQFRNSISKVTLSVSISISGSPKVRGSPTLLNHRPIDNLVRCALS
jgi:hypothetical protein